MALVYKNGWNRESVEAKIRKEFKGKSIHNEGDDCLYRFKDKKCIAGCFISDEDYTPQMEGKDIRTLMAQGVVKNMPFTSYTMDRFQAKHDNLCESKSVKDQTETLLLFLDSYSYAD